MNSFSTLDIQHQPLNPKSREDSRNVKTLKVTALILFLTVLSFHLGRSVASIQVSNDHKKGAFPGQFPSFMSKPFGAQASASRFDAEIRLKTKDGRVIALTKAVLKSKFGDNTKFIVKFGSAQKGAAIEAPKLLGERFGRPRDKLIWEGPVYPNDQASITFQIARDGKDPVTIKKVSFTTKDVSPWGNFGILRVVINEDGKFVESSFSE